MESSNVGQELLNVPFAEMVYELGNAIASAQTALDSNSMKILQRMGDEENYPVYIPCFTVDGNNGSLFEDDEDGKKQNIKTSMIGAGFQPTFYQFAETIIEVKMTIRYEHQQSYENKKQGNVTTKTKKNGFLGLFGSTKTTTTPINATYTNKYNYSAEGTSLLRTRLVPVPPNTIIQKFIDLKAQYLSLAYDAQIAALEAKIAAEQAKNASSTEGQQQAG
ncbi:MAG: hypothetical protein J6T62_04845 [Fibrobacter sp.]|nr:hypothetical protein [Fibrobacter sp.]